MGPDGFKASGISCCVTITPCPSPREREASLGWELHFLVLGKAPWVWARECVVGTGILELGCPCDGGESQSWDLPWWQLCLCPEGALAAGGIQKCSCSTGRDVHMNKYISWWGKGCPVCPPKSGFVVLWEWGRQEQHPMAEIDYFRFYF